MADIDTRRKWEGEDSWIEFARLVQETKARARRPLKRRRVAESAAPVIACYVFEDGTVRLEIRGDNR